MKNYKKYIEEVSKYIQDVENGKYNGVDLPSEIKNETSKISNNLNEFNSNVFFLLTVGAAKSGKSTLVNLLLNQDICKTGIGETTIRPAIYIPCEKDKKSIIYTFYSGTNIDAEKEKLIDDIILFARGVKKKDELEDADIRIEEREYSKSYLQDILTKDRLGSGDPLLTVVYIHQDIVYGEDEENDVLEDEVSDINNIRLAIIDMPGLDGEKSANLNSIEYKCISRKADYVLFVEGSTTALNKNSVEFVNENLLQRKPKTTLVENIFDSIWWRDPKSFEEQLDKKMKEAIRTLNENGLCDISSEQLNLRLAAEKRGLENNHHNQEGFDKLKDDADKSFKKFDEGLKAFLYQNGKKCKEDASVNGLKNNFNIISEILETKTDSISDECERIKEEYENCRQRPTPSFALNASSYSRDLITIKMGKLESEIKEKIKGIRLDSGEKIKLNALKNNIKNQSEKCLADIDGIIKDFYNGLVSNAEILDSLNKNIEKQFKDVDYTFIESDLLNRNFEDPSENCQIVYELKQFVNTFTNNLKVDSKSLLSCLKDFFTNRSIFVKLDQSKIAEFEKTFIEEMIKEFNDKKQSISSKVYNTLNKIDEDTLSLFKDKWNSLKNQQLEKLQLEIDKRESVVGAYEELYERISNMSIK